MPQHNGFIAHIKCLKTGRDITEYGRRVSGDGKTVTCYIPASTGQFFAARWLVVGKQRGVPYSAEFLRDGESVSHLFFGEEEAAAFDGGQAGDWEDRNGEKWYFVFRTFRCTGEPENCTLICVLLE